MTLLKLTLAIIICIAFTGIFFSAINWITNMLGMIFFMIPVVLLILVTIKLTKLIKN